MSTELTPEEADALREQLAAFDAAQHEAAKAANRALLAPLTSIGLGGTEPMTCSLEQAVEARRAMSCARPAWRVTSTPRAGSPSEKAGRIA